MSRCVSVFRRIIAIPPKHWAFSQPKEVCFVWLSHCAYQPLFLISPYFMRVHFCAHVRIYVCECVHVYACVHVDVRMCVLLLTVRIIYRYVFICLPLYVYVCVCVCVCVQVSVCLCIYVDLLSMLGCAWSARQPDRRFHASLCAVCRRAHIDSWN